MREREAPFYLRRVKEALVTFPDPETGRVSQLFTRRKAQTAPFKLNLGEMEFYDELTRYVEDQSIKASEDDSARGRALGFTMAIMLQRRFASSVYAVRRSLERMKATREKILADPDAYRQEQILKRIPEDFEDLPDDEQQDILLRLEEVVPSIDPASLREEIARLTKLIDAAHVLEAREIETKLTRLRERPRLGGGGRRAGQPRFRPHLPPPASGRPRHGHRGALHRGEGACRGGRDRPYQ